MLLEQYLQIFLVIFKKIVKLKIMVKTHLINLKNNKALCVEKTLIGETLVTCSPCHIKGAFKSVSRTTAGTSIITSPITDGSLYLTDLVISSEKKAGNVITIQFTDDTETISILDADATDAPVVFSVSFQGKWQGWKNARLEVVTTVDANITVACGYIKVPIELTETYTEWNANR